MHLHCTSGVSEFQQSRKHFIFLHQFLEMLEIIKTIQQLNIIYLIWKTKFQREQGGFLEKKVPRYTSRIVQVGDFDYNSY